LGAGHRSAAPNSKPCIHLLGRDAVAGASAEGVLGLLTDALSVRRIRSRQNVICWRSVPCPGVESVPPRASQLTPWQGLAGRGPRYPKAAAMDSFLRDSVAVAVISPIGSWRR
jgi:hypothetical protein